MVIPSYPWSLYIFSKLNPIKNTQPIYKPPSPSWCPYLWGLTVFLFVFLEHRIIFYVNFVGLCIYHISEWTDCKLYIVVAKKYMSQLFISRMPKMRAIPQLVLAPLNIIPTAEHFRKSHPPSEHSHRQHI